MKHAEKKSKMEFSKKILFVAGAINLAVITFTFVMVWRTNDITPLQILIPSVASEVTAGTCYYYNKAKTENIIKLRSYFGITEDQMTELKYKVENAASI